MSRNTDGFQRLRLPRRQQLVQGLQMLFDLNRAHGWILGLSLLLLLLGLGQLLLRPEAPGMLRVDGVYYTLAGEPSRTLPASAEQIGQLLHVSDQEEEAMDDWSGVRLDADWAGSPIYAKTPRRALLYLATAEGFYPFVPAPPPRLAPGVQLWPVSRPRPEVVLSEYPDTLFRWDGTQLLGLTDGGTQPIFPCTEEDSVWFADLNGDGFREICGALTSDDPVPHRLVAAYNWVEHELTVLDAPRVWDYTLELHDFRLYVQRWHYQGLEPVDRAPLILEQNGLTAEWDW